jgi:predicted RNase H-like HicB family nuclease
MITYKAAYRFEDGVYLGEVLDFPGTVACGATLEEARLNLADALLDMAETNLELGETLPRPDASRTKPESDIEEPIYLVLQTSHRIAVSAVKEPTP